MLEKSQYKNVKVQIAYSLKIGSLRASLFRIPFKIINFACTRGPSGRIPYVFANKTKTSQNLYGICDFKSRTVVLYVFLRSYCASPLFSPYIKSTGNNRSMFNLKSNTSNGIYRMGYKVQAQTCNKI